MSGDISNVEYLPIWKSGATPEERLNELVMIARKKPERFARMVIIYQEDMPDSKTLTRYISAGGSTVEILGLIELGKLELFRWAQDF